MPADDLCIYEEESLHVITHRTVTLIKYLSTFPVFARTVDHSFDPIIPRSHIVAYDIYKYLSISKSSCLTTTKCEDDYSLQHRDVCADHCNREN